MTQHPAITLPRQVLAWLIHLLTASTGIAGIFTLNAILHADYTLAFGLMGLTVFIDAIDGTLARRCHVITMAPKMDGALLDNIMDYLNYTLTPCFLLLINHTLLPDGWREITISLIILTSAYQFCQTDAKTKDHFFKGFPSYWNFAVFYLFIFNMSPLTNALILLALTMLVFVPIKYVYLSRMDHFTQHPHLRKLMMLISILFGAANIHLLFNYPNMSSPVLIYTLIYIALYFGLSIYRTIFPLSPSLRRRA